ncbi:hypothetical protein AHAS_Ahas19G0207300 [Arachis hypogaea]
MDSSEEQLIGASFTSGSGVGVYFHRDGVGGPMVALPLGKLGVAFSFSIEKAAGPKCTTVAPCEVVEPSLNSTLSDTASMWNDFPSVPSDLPPLPADSVPSVPSLPSIASDVEVEQPTPSNYNYETHGIDEDHPDDLNKNGIEGEAYKDALDLSGILPNKAAFCDAAEPWQLGFQDAISPMMQGIIDLHHDIFFFLILILVFVSRILVRALWHFHYQKNPIPQRIVHGTTIEILRTIFPSIIPMFIAIPSFALLYSMDEVVVDPAITIKAIGHQWYRTYEYSDYNSSDEQSLTFDSYTIPEDDLELGQSRLLEVDNRVVVPAKTHLRIIVTPADVPHSWAVPSLGVKCDAVPGRLNQISISVQREGVYYGQCSEICGTNHAFTPIVVEAVPSKDYGSRVSNQLIPQTTGEA